MINAVTLNAGDAIVKTLTFTLTTGEKLSRITLVLTRAHPQSGESSGGRARSMVLESAPATAASLDAVIRPASTTTSPRVRYDAELRGVVPASICGGDYIPVYCVFSYADEHPPTAFEIAADQRFVLNVTDDASSYDAGPAIVAIA